MVLMALVVYSASDIFMPSIAYMAEDLGVSEAVATSNFSSYYLMLMIGYVVFGPLCDRIAKKTLLLVSIVGCLAGCILCAAAQNMLMMNIGRGMQALATGLVLLTTQVWIGTFSNKKNMLNRLGWFSLVTALAPVLAPVLGGVITDMLTWRYNFWLIAVLCVVVGIVLAGSTIDEEEKEDARRFRLGELIKATLKGYWWALMHSTVERFSLALQGLFFGQGAFFAVASFLFVKEFGVSAGTLGLLSTIMVGGLLAGRFLAMYLRKRFSNYAAFMVNAAFVAVSALALLSYCLIVGGHNAAEVIAGMTVQAIGFSGLAILSLNNCMLTAGEKKGVVSGMYNFMNQGASLLGILLVQAMFSMDYSGGQIFQTVIYIVLACAVCGAILFIRAYPNYKVMIE